MTGIPNMSNMFEFYKNQETIRLLQIYLEIIKRHKEKFFWRSYSNY